MSTFSSFNAPPEDDLTRPGREYAGRVPSGSVWFTQQGIAVRRPDGTVEHHPTWNVAEVVNVANGPATDDTATDETGRHVHLTPASAIKIKPVHWLYADRIARGTLALIAGPEGVGKSTTGYWMAAEITQGTLPGELMGQPRAVLICASEDSWEHTIVPRLIAHGADLDLVFRVDVTHDGILTGLDLPRDLVETERAALECGAAVMILDPLMSRVSDKLDTHKDGDVRRALEPLVAMADRCNMAIVGLIHHNKSGSANALDLVMASKAFTAVARSVHTVIKDPDDDTEQRRLFGTVKNNLGRSDLPTLAFTIVGHAIPTDDGDAWTGRLVWGSDAEGTIGDAMRRSADQGVDRSATTEAAEWLQDWLTEKGGIDASANIKRAGQAVGHSHSTLGRARARLHIETTTSGFPRQSWWALPGTQPTTSEETR